MFSLTYPLNMQVETTEACNHACLYCYNHWRTKRNAGKMSEDQAKRLAEIIEEDIHPFHVTITGGEPLLNMAATLTLARELKKRGTFYNLNTNLVLLNEERLAGLQEAACDGRFGILTSLPHHEAEVFKAITGRDTLEEFYRNLRRVSREDLPVTVNMVVHSMNQGAVYDEGRFLFEEFGIRNFAATPMLEPSMRLTSVKPLSTTEINRVLEDLLRLHEDLGISVDTLETIPRCALSESLRNNSLQLFNRACSAGRSTLSIGYDGNVRSCSHSPIPEGNIFTDGFSQLWERLQPYRDNQYVPEECDDCQEFFGCYGGCRFNGFQEGDSLKTPDRRMTSKILTRKAIQREIPRISEDQRLRANPNTVSRRERENLYTFFNGNFAHVLFVNEAYKQVIDHLATRGTFTPRELDLGEERDKAMTLLGVLVDRKYLFVET
ncbi:MAG: radical SAM protein [Candidatus Woesearchaeota archaeon]|nr:MAG: radical SAM protein [Candidatus Woesearchaeota archaeon]